MKISLIICAALLTDFIVAFVSKKFSGMVYSDNTHLFAVNTENCPTTIGEKYSGVLWDNEDYAIELCGNMSKN